MYAQQAYAETPWGQVHYRTTGRGAPLLLLHSSSGSSRVYRMLMPLLAGFRVVAPDLPGFGESAPLPAQVTMNEVAGSMIELLDTLGIERTHVFGMHSGNKVAAALASGWPQRVERLIIAGMTHSLVVDTRERNIAVLGYAGRLPAPGTPADERVALFAKMQKLWQDSGIDDIERVVAETLDLLQSRAGVDAMYRANLGFDLAQSLSRVAAATLILELTTAAEADLGLQAPMLASLMPNGQSTALPGNDRDLLQQGPGRLAEVISRFLLSA